MPPREKTKRTAETVAFGRRLRQLRTDRCWTQEQLAERAGMNAVQLGHIERGANEPKLTTILKLAQALGVGPAELFDCGS